MPSRTSDWKSYTPDDIRKMSSAEKQDLFNQLERNHRALKNDRSMAYELPRLERVLGFLGAKKDSTGSWTAPDFNAGSPDTGDSGNSEVYKEARRMEAERKREKALRDFVMGNSDRHAEDKSAVESAGPAAPMVFDEPLDVFGRMPTPEATPEPTPADAFKDWVLSKGAAFRGGSAPEESTGPLRWRRFSTSESPEPAPEETSSPRETTGMDFGEGLDLTDIAPSVVSTPSISDVPSNVPGVGDSVDTEVWSPSAEVAEDEMQARSDAAEAMAKRAAEVQRASDQEMLNRQQKTRNNEIRRLSEIRNKAIEQDKDFDEEAFARDNEALNEGLGEGLSGEEVEVASVLGRPQDFENFELPEEMFGSNIMRFSPPSRPSLLDMKGEDASVQAFINKGEELKAGEGKFREWLKAQGLDRGIDSSAQGRRSEGLRNEMQALIMAKAGLPYSPQTSGGGRSGTSMTGTKGAMTPGQTLTQQRWEQDRADRAAREGKKDTREEARIKRETDKFDRQMEFRQTAEDFKREKFKYDQGENKEDAKRKMLDRANDLSKQFNALPEVKVMTELSRQSDNLKAGLSKKTGAGDQAAIMSFNKMMDPGSVVRESEFAASAEGAGLISRLESLINLYSGKGRLDDTARAQLQDAANEFERSSQKYYQKRLGQYQNMAEDFDIDPNVQKHIFPTWFGGGIGSSSASGSGNSDSGEGADAGMSSGDGKPGIPITTPVTEPPPGSPYAPKKSPTPAPSGKRTGASGNVTVTRTKNGKTEKKVVPKAKLEGMKALGWMEAR